jgi:hypothetical protein
MSATLTSFDIHCRTDRLLTFPRDQNTRNTPQPPRHQRVQECPVDDERFDAITRILARTRSRRRALRLAAGAVLGAALTAVVAKQAGALTKDECRNAGGVPLRRGNCRCAITCTAPLSAPFVCNGNNSCQCHKRASGKGFCAYVKDPSPQSGCANNKGCPPGTVCLQDPGCPQGSCTSTTPCPANHVCIKGFCRNTYCLPPCPS